MAVWETYMFFAAAEKLPSRTTARKYAIRSVFMRKTSNEGQKTPFRGAQKGAKMRAVKGADPCRLRG